MTLELNGFDEAAQLIQDMLPGWGFELAYLQNAGHGIEPAGPGIACRVFLIEGGATRALGYGKDRTSAVVAAEQAIAHGLGE